MNVIGKWALVIATALGFLGTNAAEDPVLARMKKEAEQGDADAQVAVGKIYRDGIGVDKDPEEATKLLRMAANQGSTEGQFNLGLLFLFGDAGVKDIAEGLKWVRKAADQGDSYAQYFLGFEHEQGVDTPTNYVEAARWFRMAAEQGQAGGQHGIGRCYLYGRGVEKDALEAAKWLRLAALQDSEDSQTDLGELYESGKGVPLDYVEAYAWYNVAGKGCAAAREKRDLLEKRMASDQVTAAQTRARGFRTLIDQKVAETTRLYVEAAVRKSREKAERRAASIQQAPQHKEVGGSHEGGAKWVGGEFEVTFPKEPRNYELKKTDMAGRAAPMKGAEVVLQDPDTLLRVEVVEIDEADAKAFDQARSDKAMEQIAKDMGIARPNWKFEESQLGKIGTLWGPRETRAGRMLMKVTNMVGKRSLLTVYVACPVEKFQTQAMEAFQKSVRRTGT